ncbi:DUF1236 domain-containing protein [Aquabacter sp. CN5-332]|uniref:DUF1236 domain-containing protein n=1 Tax=Aquabacter sp. CN5-332 TaxID=3156608 RepID=UPI0032B3209F
MRANFAVATIAALLVTAPALAQTSTTTTVSPSGSSSVSVTTEQRTKIRDYVVREQRPSVAAPSGFTVSTGATVPQSVELYSFPSDVGVSRYRYSVIGGQTVLVEPGTRKVIQIIE